MRESIVPLVIGVVAISIMWFLCASIPEGVKCIDGKLYNWAGSNVYTLSTLKDPSCVEVK